MTTQRKVTVERQSLKFAAAHFATFSGRCEPLHGHNYAVIVEVEGELTADSWVFDFGDLKRSTRRLCDELDHKFLLQMDSRVLDIDDRGDEYEVRFGDGPRYVFPKSDVYPLPKDNSTAERIAEWFVERLCSELRDRAPNLTHITVGIEEAPGQAGWYSADFG